ncbi:MAG: phosphatase PAP2 family protein [Frankiales bacterium]|nr:MAG: phosphatase PAP2 family protein [Frankiales bacterium]
MTRDDVRTRIRGLVRLLSLDALVIVSGVVVYFGVRGLTAENPERAREHALDILALEKTLGLDVEAGVQAVLLDLHWVTTLANWVYIWGHWPVIAVTFVWLALRNRVVFRRLRNAMIASGALGLCVYTTYPVAPPRLLHDGYVDTITEQSNAYRVLQPPAFTNQYAAMPSLHVGWDLLVGLAIAAAAGTLIMRTLGRLMPALMAAATVITANHYVLDALVGAAFALVGYAVALDLEKRRERHQAPAAAVDLSPPALPRPRGAGEGRLPDAPRSTRAPAS